jgi:formylglycine-generating enzyme required for sulfatase activity
MWSLMLAVLLLWGNPQQVAGVEAEHTLPPPGMVALPAGTYTPLLQGNAGPVTVAPFYLDQYAVTNTQYLAFVTAHPRWRRSQVARLFADQSYLRHWQDDLYPAEAAAALWHSPVTSVSWFAARAYCRWQQKRLPSTAEWEYAALASAEAPDGRSDPTYLRRLLAWYAVPNPTTPSPIGSGGKNYWGVYDLHGVVWEWVADFHTAMGTGESRGDGDLERQLFCGAGASGVTEQERVNYPAFMRAALRSSLQGHYTVPNVGFRCAKDREEPEQ